MITAHRIVKTRYLDTALTGEGARRTGGRWNPIGVPVVYLASSLSLATLELFVHTKNYSMLLKLFSTLTVSFNESDVEHIAEDDLPRNWSSAEVLTGTQLYGAAWFSSRRSLALAIPSAVTAGELNYLLNPEHPRFETVKVGPAQKFSPDPRLIR